MDERGVKLYVYLLKQDDPKKCTSAKLRRFKLVKPFFQRRYIPKRAVVLNPFAQEVLYSGDREALKQGGVVAVDCSWKKADQVFSKRFKGINRRLPILLAANPINYGRLSKLSSVEALAAALYITNFTEEAKEILTLFKWGIGFLELNREPFDAYRSGSSRTEITRMENLFFSLNV